MNSAQQQAASPQDPDRLYLEGLKAFQEGNNSKAVELLYQAARLSPQCKQFLSQFRVDNKLSQTTCADIGNQIQEKSANVGLMDQYDDPRDEVLYRLGLERWREENQAQGKESRVLAVHSYDFLQDLIHDHPESPYADNAELLIMEDAFCENGQGYPECAHLEILKYEDFLKKFPKTDLKTQVIYEIGTRYASLALLYRQSKPWENDALAELCLAQALNQLNYIQNTQDKELAEKAKTEVEKLMRGKNNAVKSSLPFETGWSMAADF